VTVLKYRISPGVCTTAELIAFKKLDPTGAEYRALAQLALDEMKHKGIEVDAPEVKS